MQETFVGDTFNDNGIATMVVRLSNKSSTFAKLFKEEGIHFAAGVLFLNYYFHVF